MTITVDDLPEGPVHIAIAARCFATIYEDRIQGSYAYPISFLRHDDDGIDGEPRVTRKFPPQALPAIIQLALETHDWLRSNVDDRRLFLPANSNSPPSCGRIRDDAVAPSATYIACCGRVFCAVWIRDAGDESSCWTRVFRSRESRTGERRRSQQFRPGDLLAIASIVTHVDGWLRTHMK